MTKKIFLTLLNPINYNVLSIFRNYCNIYICENLNKFEIMRGRMKFQTVIIS